MLQDNSLRHGKRQASKLRLLDIEFAETTHSGNAFQIFMTRLWSFIISYLGFQSVQLNCVLFPSACPSTDKKTSSLAVINKVH